MMIMGCRPNYVLELLTLGMCGGDVGFLICCTSILYLSLYSVHTNDCPELQINS